MNDIVFLYDCIRSPFDIVQILQMRNKTDIKVETSRTSLPFNHPKVLQKCSIKEKKIAPVKNHENLEEAISQYKQQGYTIIGTSPASTKSLYDTNLEDKKVVFVYGNESSGLPNRIQRMMDEMITLPMNPDNLSFMTIPVVTGAIAAECIRTHKTHTIAAVSNSNPAYHDISIVFAGIKSYYDSCLMLQAILALDFSGINVYSTKANLDLSSKRVKDKVFSWNAKRFPTIQTIDSLDSLLRSMRNEGKSIVGFYNNDNSADNFNRLYSLDPKGSGITLVFGDIDSATQKLIDYMIPYPISDNNSLGFNFSSILFDLHRRK